MRRNYRRSSKVVRPYVLVLSNAIPISSRLSAVYVAELHRSAAVPVCCAYVYREL